MRRGLTDGDFPLTMYGSAIFAADDPVPLFVCPTVDAADTLFRLLSIGYDTSAHVVQSGHDTALLGERVMRLFVSTPERDPELPLEVPPTPEGWTLDGGVKPA